MRTLPVLFLFCALLGLSACQPNSPPSPSGPTGDSTPLVTNSPVLTPTPGAIPRPPEFVKTQRDEPPLGLAVDGLTTTDGTGLRLVDLKARAVLEGPLAFTQLHLTFENPENRVLEGRFHITMPEKAAISRFAMKVGKGWQEAEVVELQEARRVYEDFLHRRQDPALLEKEAGNEFHARIFPIPAKGRKEILLSYSQELPSSSTPYLLPLQGLPKMDNLRIEVQADGDDIEPVLRQNFQPDGDFVVPQRSEIKALRGGQMMVARVRPRLSSQASAPEDLLVLVDTSASRALGFSHQIEMLSSLLKGLPKLKKLTVAAFDQQVAEIYQGAPDKFSAQPLLQRKALGATDLQAALSWAARRPGHTRLLLVTDGITTAGAEELGKALQDSALQRLDVILVGGIRDKDRMDLLVSDSLKQQGIVLDGQLPPLELARRLSQSVTSGLDVAVEGAEWVWPLSLDNVQPGDERLIYAKLKKPVDNARISLGGDQNLEFSLQQASVLPLLERAAAVTQVARLESLRSEATEESEKGRLAKEIVALSTSQRVLSGLTAMLVLETEEDYASFSIDRKALADVLEVDDNLRLVSLHRKDIALPVTEPIPPANDPADLMAADMGSSSTANEYLPPGASADDGVVRSSHENVDTPRGVESSREYTREVESANYLVAQSRSRRVDFAADEQPDGAPARAMARSRPATEAASAPRAAAAPRSAPSPSAPAPTTVGGAQPFNDSPGFDLSGTSRPAPPPPPPPIESEEMAPGGNGTAALSGRMAEIEGMLKAGKTKDALAKAWAWQQAQPGDVLAYLALGSCLEAVGDRATAARVYGSIIDLFPSRADLRRYAGSRLQGLPKEGLALAVDSFQKAVEQRPDHVSSHRFLAFGLVRQGQYEEAFSALEAGLKGRYGAGRFREYQRILKEDLGLVGAAWAAREPARSDAIAKRLTQAGARLDKEASLRFILTWETDANDVDFHIRDARGGHAYYGSPLLASGGSLYADVTDGYGPECFAIPGTPKAYPYQLEIHYYNRGPMGYGLGQLEVLQHDGKGTLRFEQRPYVVMNDQASVDLGVVKGPL
jgi:tetratricopeptide (TPR) repeat protein